MTEEDRKTIEQALSDLDARYATERYPATTVLWEMASRQRQPVAGLLHDYFQAGDPPAVVDQRQAAPNSLEALSDPDLVEKVAGVLAAKSVHVYFSREQLSFLADLHYKLNAHGQFTSRQRRYVVDLVRKAERFVAE